ncbi:PDZ domain-containing protein [Halioglobus maricola]|uniref:PDZ domain-containing protein n=1 Tax=Halioglobus maricola TaxID=2601894 RepID=A0A5P9NMY5_9GAMM|nr:aspartyl protease family protein [Halioglobus maricola]QFU76856.1 PDZ domain-containing protein [Halioglobus maricola]
MHDKPFSPTTHIRVLLAALLCSLATGCELVTMARFSYDNATAPHSWHNGTGTTTVPFSLVDNHIILPVRVNDSAPLNFVLDSGAAASVLIDSRGSRALKLQPSSTITVSGVGNGPDPTAAVIRDTTLGVGSLEMEEQSLIHLPLEAIPFFRELDDAYFDGVIGAPFFSRFLVAIDYGRMEISFSEPGYFSEPGDEEQQQPGAGWQSVPLEIISGVPYLHTRVSNDNGTPVDVMLLADTGARGTVSLTPATHAELEPPRYYYSEVGQGLSGDVISRVTMAPSLTLANYQLGHLPVSYDIDGGEQEAGSNGILGNEILRRFNLVFDYSSDRLYLQPNDNFSDSLEADRSGLQVRPHTAGAIVRKVAGDSTASKSGLAEGDIITSFDGIAVTPTTIAGLKRALTSHAAAIHLCWTAASLNHCEDVALAPRMSQHET